MENNTENNAGQTIIPAEIPATSLGTTLREARERLGLSVMDVSSQIKFAPKQIEALEADDYEHLPETAFLRGFVRSYAKILHLDAQTVLAALPRNKPEGDLLPDSVGEPFPDVHSLFRQNLIWSSAAFLVIMMVAGFAFWHFTTPPEQSQVAQVESPVSLPPEVQVAPVAQPVSEVPAIEPVATRPQAVAELAQSSVQATPTVAPRLAQRNQAITSDTPSDTTSDTTPITSLLLEFSEESWAEIKDKDGKILSSRVHPGGTELRISGRAPFSVLIGHASSVKLQYQDKPIDLVPHTRRSTDVASLTLE
jgi:cytoskeleton protein RodZ